jgi:hypothetical protein
MTTVLKNRLEIKSNVARQTFFWKKIKAKTFSLDPFIAQ